MKKLVLAVAVAFGFMTANAQNSFILLSETGATQFGNGGTFDGLVASTSTVSGKAAFLLSGTTTGYYAGGYGNGIPVTGGGAGYSTIPFTGPVTSSSFVFQALTSEPLKIKFQFKNAGTTFAFEKDFGTGTGGVYQSFTIAGTSFKELVGNDPTGPVISDNNLSTMNEFQAIFVYTGNNGVGSGSIALTNLAWVNTNVVTSYSSNDFSNSVSLAPNPSSEGYINVNTDLNVSNIAVMNAQGAFVNAPVNGNRVNTANLTPGVYTLLIDTEKGRTAKKVVVE